MSISADARAAEKPAGEKAAGEAGAQSLVQGMQKNFAPTDARPDAAKPDGSKIDAAKAPGGEQSQLEARKKTPSKTDGPQGPKKAGDPPAEPPKTGVKFKPFQLMETKDGRRVPVDRARYPNLPYDKEGKLDLNRVTPKMLRDMPAKDRREFMKLLRENGNYPHNRGNLAKSELNDVAGLDLQLALHVHRQDPSGKAAAMIFSTNPDTIEGLQRGLHQVDPAQANKLALGVFGNLDHVTDPKISGNPDRRLSYEHVDGLRNLMKDNVRLNSQDPNKAALRLIDAADQSLGRMPQRGRGREDTRYNEGAVMAGISAGLSESKVDMGDLLETAAGFLPGRVGSVAGPLIGILREALGTEKADSTGYVDRISEYLSQRGGNVQQQADRGNTAQGYREMMKRLGYYKDPF